MKKNTDKSDAPKDNASFLAAIIRTSDDAIAAQDLNGNVLVWNRGCEELYGFTEAEVMGRSALMLYPENKKQELITNIATIKDGKHVEPYITQRIKKDGSVIEVAISASPIMDAAGKVVAASFVTRPFVGQERVAQYSRSLIEASLDPLVTISPEGKITDVNEATIKVTGVKRENLVGSDFLDYFTEPDKAREGYLQVFSKGKVTDYPLTIRRADGALIDVLYNASVYKDETGNVLGVFAAARDVTAQKQASRYARSLIDASLDPLLTISADGKITDVNEATVQVTGVAREKLIGNDFSIIFTEPEEARQGYQQVFKEGLVRDYPLTIRGKNGTLTDVLYNASVYKDDKGNVLGVFAAARDTTARKKAEEQLHATSAYTRSIIEASHDPFVTITADGKIADCNHAMEVITGVTREWLIGSDFTSYFTEPRKAREGYRKVLKENSVSDFPLTLRPASGQPVDVLFNATVYRDAGGKVQGIAAVARDVTETKKASQYARSLIEASQDPLVTISPTGKITDVNEATVRVTGMPREKLIGTDFSDYFSEPQKAREGYTQAFKLGFVTDYPLTIRSVTGQLTDVLYNASVYKDDKGNVLGIFAAARDNTKAKLFAEQLGETNNDLEAFSNAVSHDLRAPLVAISGFTKILVEDYPWSEDDNGRKMIETIQERAVHMSKLIDDLLDFSRLGRRDIKKVSLNMKDLAAAVYDDLKLADPKREIVLQLGPLADAFADPALIRQVWVNLFSNAIKYTRQRKDAKIEVSSKEENGFITYIVKDNGVGFDMQYATKLFGTFQRLHSDEQFEGTGVGLSIVQRIIAKHGGKIWADAKVGEGATFSFSLPSGKLKE